MRKLTADEPVRSTRFRFVPWIVVGLALIAIVGGAVYWNQRNQHRPPETTTVESAIADLDQGDFSAARKLVSQLKATPDAGSGTVALLRGAMLLRKGHPFPALDELEKAAEESETRQRARCLIGEAWYLMGRHLEAQMSWQQVLADDPDSVDANRWLAASYYDQGAIHDALRHLKRTARLAPKDPRPHRLLGLIYKDYERYDDAIPCYAESLRRKADQADAEAIRQELAACQIKQRQHEEALITLRDCPESTDTASLRAECHYALGEISLAERDLDQVLKQDANHLGALLLRGTMLLESSNDEQAVTVLEHATRTHSQDYLAHFKLAQAYAKAGNDVRAAEEQKTAADIRAIREEFAELHRMAWDRPLDRNVRLRLAAIAKRLEMPEIAADWLKAADALQPLPGNVPDGIP